MDDDALQERAAHERRMAALDELVESWEAEHGPITDAEIAESDRWVHEHAIRVRGAHAAP